MYHQNVNIQSDTFNSPEINLTISGLKAPLPSSTFTVINPPGVITQSHAINNPFTNICTSKIAEEIKDIYDPMYKRSFDKSDLNNIAKDRLNAVERLPEVDIEGVVFSITKRDVIKKFTIIDNTNSSGPGSLNDSTLGPSKNSEICGLCQQDSMRCPGHFGRIPLQELSDDGQNIIDAPMINPFYRREIISFLTVYCNDCGAALITENEIKAFGLENGKAQKSRLKIIEDFVKSKKIKHSHRKTTLTDVENLCIPFPVGEVQDCEPNPKYILDKGGNNHIIEYSTSLGKYERTINDIVKIFESITPEDAKLMGLGDNMPIDFIIYDVIVMPPNIRGASLYETENESDRMAATYKEIIKANNILKSGMTKQGKSLPLHELQSQKQRQKKIIFDNVKNLIDNRDVKAIKGVNQSSAHGLLQGKEGIIRASIMARRSDFTGRTVISPDPSLEFNEISVPLEWASILTMPVTICDINIELMHKLLQSGKITHITKGSGPKKGLRSKVTDSNYQNFSLEYGDRVDRWLQNGDYLTLNRMPSLHKQSMMTGKVKLWDHRTLGLHLSYTTPFNADYDGDEMNVHVPQTFDALAEAVTLMNMEMCIPNEQNNAPIMGLVMDAVIGAGLLTMEDEIMDISEWNDYLMMLSSRDDLATLDERLLEMGVKKYTGKALFSSLLPSNFYYDIKDIVIKKGILINGYITKNHIGPSAGSIIHAMYNNPVITGVSKLQGLKRAGIFITDATRMMGSYIVKHGFTVGLRDCGYEVIELENIKKESLIKLGIQVSQIGERFNSYGDTKKKEQEVIITTSNIRNNMGKQVYDLLPDDNAFKVMITTKSKGTEHNFTQIAVMIGQQMFAGKRMTSQMSSGRRTLPHFLMNDDSLEAHGLVKSSYREGLSPIEFFFHSYGSREGLIDSAVKISDIGSIHREMSVMFQDCKVAYDGSVRDSNNLIIQGIYGGDSFAGGSLQKSKINKRSPFSDDTLSIIDVHQLSKTLNTKYGYSKVEVITPNDKFWYQ